MRLLDTLLCKIARWWSKGFLLIISFRLDTVCQRHTRFVNLSWTLVVQHTNWAGCLAVVPEREQGNWQAFSSGWRWNLLHTSSPFDELPGQRDALRHEKRYRGPGHLDCFLLLSKQAFSYGQNWVSGDPWKMNHFQSGRARLTARVRATRISSTISSFSNPLHSIIEEKTGKTFDLAQQFHMLQASGKIVLTGLIWILWPYSNTVFEKHRKVLFNIASEVDKS